MRTFELQIITLTDETRLKLDNFAKRFNLALHHLYKEDCKVNNKLTKNQFKSEYQHDFNLNARHFNSVFDTMRGNTSSALECAKLHLENIRLKLYDIKKDPFEMNNLADVKKYSKKKAELTMELQKWMKQQKAGRQKSQ